MAISCGSVRRRGCYPGGGATSAAWSALYSTVSRPLDPPETGKIAVKIINDYVDDVLKVYAV